MTATLPGEALHASFNRALDRAYEALAHAVPAAAERVEPHMIAGRGTPVVSEPETAGRRPFVETVGDEPQDSAPHLRLQTVFGLSDFELDILMLCAGAGLESRFTVACTAAHADPRVAWPTFGLALQCLEGAHWSALSRARPLRYWSLIDVGGGPLLHAPLSIAERVLQHLLGVPTLDEGLEGLARPLVTGDDSVPAKPGELGPAARHWRRTPSGRSPVLILGSRRSSRQAAFVEICRQTGLQPYELDAADIAEPPADRERLARLWTRESALEGAALLIHTDNIESLRSLSAWLDRVGGPVALGVQPGSPAEVLDGLRLYVQPMPPHTRARVWAESLGPMAQQLNGYLDRIVDYFQFDDGDIQVIASMARDTAHVGQHSDAGALIWHMCREHGRRRLDHLARRIESRSDWDTLVLPSPQIETLRQIAVHVRRRYVVNDKWGFAQRSGRGLGLSALFAGASGTGKTMAAEILATDLDLDLYHIDLASVVSKYIGETEKNLRTLFDAAEAAGAILLFDEADALFGKRSEVRDSHDRYANLEISYLLQRMEGYRGIAILTTNMQHALDPAFMRRIRFIVQFPFPDAPARSRIWRTMFPPDTPVGKLDWEQLAQLNVAGGVIRNIAMHAAYLAADEGAAVEMRHVLGGARIEYAKIDKPLTAAETRGWV